MPKEIKLNDFEEKLFEGLNPKAISNKFLTMKRVSDNKEKVIVKLGEVQLYQTKYGYALILDRTHVVFIRDWQVNKNWYGCEVLINKSYWQPKEWGQWKEFDEDESQLDFNTWVELAKAQDIMKDEQGEKVNRVHWQVKGNVRW